MPRDVHSKALFAKNFASALFYDINFQTNFLTKILKILAAKCSSELQNLGYFRRVSVITSK